MTKKTSDQIVMTFSEDEEYDILPTCKYIVSKENRTLKKEHYFSGLHFNQLTLIHRKVLDKYLFKNAYQNSSTLKKILLQYDKHFE